MYPIEASLCDGLCMVNMGGSGDVATLAAAERMELMAFAQMSSQIGGLLFEDFSEVDAVRIDLVSSIDQLSSPDWSATILYKIVGCQPYSPQTKRLGVEILIQPMVEQLQSDAVYNDPAPYSQGIIHGETIRLAGQVPDNSDGAIVGDDIETQTRQAIGNVESLLSEADSSLESVVSVTAYLTDMDDLEAFNRVYAGLFPDPKPARATVAVAGLAVDARLELQVTAVVE